MIRYARNVTSPQNARSHAIVEILCIARLGALVFPTRPHVGSRQAQGFSHPHVENRVDSLKRRTLIFLASSQIEDQSRDSSEHSFAKSKMLRGPLLLTVPRPIYRHNSIL